MTNMKSHWIEHEGRRIFYADYSDFRNDSEALRNEMEPAVSTIAAEPPRSVLVLVNFEGTIETMANLDVVRKLTARSNHAVIKRALLGVHGVRRIFITTFGNVVKGTSVKAFDSREKALDWLVSEG
jgi:hypothetical protein